jgi:hypothetical protein
MSQLLTAAEILAADDLPREKVECPEWGGHLYIRTLTGKERDAFEASVVGKGSSTNLVNVRARLVALAGCNDAGEPIFTAAQVDALGDKSAAALSRCFDVASRLNHLSNRDIEELEKNSDGVQSDSFG